MIGTEVDILNSVSHWASHQLIVKHTGAGLDMRQLMQQWTWWRFANGESTEETELARSALPRVLENLGGRKQLALLGGAKYEWWTVAPTDWIVGRRDLPTEFLSKLGASHFEMGEWVWENRQSLGEAAGELLWKFRRLEIVGVLADDIGYLNNDFARRHIPAFPEKGDEWQWQAFDRKKPLGPGKIGVSVHELRFDFLQKISKNK